jgi:hypothetical protein
MQEPVQLERVPEQLDEHTPRLQTSDGEHAVAHVPQWVGSLDTSTHAEPQTRWLAPTQAAPPSRLASDGASLIVLPVVS